MFVRQSVRIGFSCAPLTVGTVSFARSTDVYWRTAFGYRMVMSRPAYSVVFSAARVIFFRGTHKVRNNFLVDFHLLILGG